MKAGKSVYFCTLAELIAALARAEREGRLQERIRFFCRPALLVVDEIGYLPVVPGGGNLFFQLVNARYERGAMILTSNRGFAEWGEVFRSRRRHRAARPAAAPCRRRPDRRLELPAQAARRTHAGTPAIQSRHHAAGDQPGAAAARKTTEKSATLRDELSGRTGEVYFGTFGENSRGIDMQIASGPFEPSREASRRLRPS